MKVWLFKNIVFRYVALVTKKLWAILDFFPKTGLFLALFPTQCIYIFTKNPLNYFSLKVTKFHDDSVKNERNYKGGGGVTILRRKKVFSISNM